MWWILCDPVRPSSRPRSRPLEPRGGRSRSRSSAGAGADRSGLAEAASSLLGAPNFRLLEHLFGYSPVIEHLFGYSPVTYEPLPFMTI